MIKRPGEILAFFITISEANLKILRAMKTVELIFKIILTAFFTAIWLILIDKTWKSHIDLKESFNQLFNQTTSPPSWIATREENKIYQNGIAIGEITGKVTNNGKEIIFSQISNTSNFDINIPFEYQRFRIKVHKVERFIGNTIELTPTGIPQTITNVYEGVYCQVISKNQ